ncbi:GFA family protein [Mesorhizobium sp. UC22_110]|uniref:GFA family protein n=2 Tax=unclassified Mesorhizobium TaxID=325217 RepID=UPI003756EE45
MAVYRGGCHCGNVVLSFETAIAPWDIEIRACQCSFCRRHNSLAAADPNGMLTIHVQSEALLSRYAFGLRTAEYLVCRDCGVYVAAATTDSVGQRVIVIVNALDGREQFRKEPIPTVYDAETRDERVARRRSRWMPVKWSSES